MFASLDVANLLFDGLVFTAVAYLYFNYFAGRAMSFTAALQLGAEFVLALIVARFIFSSVTGIPEFLRSMKGEFGVDLLAIGLLALYFGFKYSFSSAVIMPLLIIGVVTGITGSVLKRVFADSGILPPVLSAPLKKMSSPQKAPIPSEGLIGGGL